MSGPPGGLPDPDSAAEALRSLGVGGVPAIDGAPPRDLVRSPAAAAVARHAARSGLFLTHYEHRVQLELPWSWLPEGADDGGAPPAWTGGVLPERKYQSFRHDDALGSMHPGHRGKWSTHELCHGLVGHAWAPDATAFFLATAGRLAELLPVALYYFFDEAFLRRCPDHAGGGALFRSFCPACEAVASFDPGAPGARSAVADGLAFLDRELAAIARSRRLGRPISHRLHTLDLASDGVAYALAHGPRLASPEFAAWVDAFDRGRSEDLDALEARVLAVAAALLGGDVAPLAPSPDAGRRRWIAADLAWRFATVRAETDGDAAEGLDALLARLAAEADEPGGPARAAAAYRALLEDWELPPPEDLEATGYRWAAPTSSGPIAAGLLSACPRSARAGDVDAFAAWDLAHPERRPLADRWASWLEGGPLRELARYEAALVGAGREVTLPGGSGPVRLARGARVERFACDVAALDERLEPTGEARTLAFVRSADGDVLVAELEAGAAEVLGALGEGGRPELGDDAVAALLELGVLVPAAWAERR